MIEIKPTPIPLRNSEANYITMRSEFDLGAETSRVFWIVHDSARRPIANGTVDIDADTHLSWGEDDKHIEDYVLNQLNLERYENLD